MSKEETVLYLYELHQHLMEHFVCDDIPEEWLMALEQAVEYMDE